MSRKSNDNRIVDNRGMRKTINVKARKTKRLSPGVKGALIGTGVILLLALAMFLAFTLFGNKKNDETLSDNSVSNNVSDNIVVNANDEVATVSEDEVELPEDIIEEDSFFVNVSPTGFEINIEGLNREEYTVYYYEANAVAEKHGKDKTEDGTRAMNDICGAYVESADDVCLTRIVTLDTAYVSGLKPSTEYAVEVYDMGGNQVSSNKVTTTNEGYCDPFKSIDSLFSYVVRDEETGQIVEKQDTKTVVMSSNDGCLGAECFTMMETGLYDKANLTGETGKIKGSVKVIISLDEEGHYCYYMPDGAYAVYVKSEDGSKEGWINARTLMIDVKKLYTPENYIYGIQINRANAVSSIFTAGGDVAKVDYNPDTLTRFNAVSSNNPAEFMTVSGNNIIDDITGNVLPNYGSPEQMPLVWDMALELKQCQKNALENGYTLLIYEGYRPASTSLAVFTSLSNSGYLGYPANGTNLAQGYLTDQNYGVSFYIAKRSRHNRGIATDITIMGFNSPDEIGDEIVMQTKMHTLDYRCNMHYNNWQADLLTDIMIGHGSNLEYLAVRSEWWHFQLRTDRKDLYPLIDEYTYMDFVF